MNKILFRALFLVPILLSSMTSAQIYHLDIRLEGAVGKGDDLEVPRPLTLWVEYNNGSWMPVAGRSPGLSDGNHYGRVIEGTMGENEISLTLDVVVNRTEYVPGGHGRYEVTLTRDENDSLHGTYTGTYAGHNYVWRYRKITPSSTVTGRIAGPIEKDSNWKSLVTGEHPRVLFRKDDIPYLKAKAQTAFGQAAFELMTDAVGNGIKYQLTGGTEYADEAKAQVVALMADYNNGSGSGRFGWAPRWEQIVLAYDLCYDAWSEEFRREIRHYMTWMSKDVYIMADAWGGGEMDYGLLGHAAVLYESLAMAGLAMTADSAPEPARPPYPFGDSLDAPIIEPLPESFTPPEDVPLVNQYFGPLQEIHRFKNSSMSGYWIYVDGLFPREGEDPFESMGGIKAARPRPGDIITCNGETDTFRLTSPDLFFNDEFCGLTLDLTKMTNREFFSTSYIYAYIRNDEARWVEFNTGGYKHPEWLPYATMYINGVERENNDFAYLKPGVYAVMIELPIKWCQPHGKIFTASRFVEPTEHRRTLNIEILLEKYGWDIENWEALKERWQTDHSDQYLNELFYRGRANMRWYIRDAIEQSGHFPRLYSWKGIDIMAVRYVSLFERMMGEPLNPLIDWKAGAVKQLLTNDEVDGSISNMNTFFAPLYPILPDNLKAGVLDVWNDKAGVTDESNPTEVLNAPYPITVSHAFVNYPLQGVSVQDGKTRRPAVSKQAVPTAVASTGSNRIRVTVSGVGAGLPVSFTIRDLRGVTVAHGTKQASASGMLTCTFDRVSAGGIYLVTASVADGAVLKQRIVLR